MFLETNNAEHWLAILPFIKNEDQRQFLLPMEVRFRDQSTTTSQWIHVQRWNNSLYLKVHYSGEINRLGVVVLHWVDRGVGEPWELGVAPDTMYILDGENYAYTSDELDCPALADLDLKPNNTGVTRVFFVRQDTGRK